MNSTVSELNKILSDYNKGNKYSAYSKLKKFSKKNPKNEKIKFNIAVMEQDQGLNSMAKRSYEKLIHDFDNFNAKINLYLLYLGEKEYFKAISIIELILKIKPQLNDVLLDKAFILFKSKNSYECIKICNSVLSKEKNNIKAINLIGQCFLEEKKYVEAEEKFLKAISYEHNNIAILNSLGKLYFEKYDLKKSENSYLKALQYNPKSYQTLNNLAGFYLEINKSNQALIYYQKALDIFSNEPTILNNLSKTYLSLNDTEKAEKYCLSALNIKEEDSFKKTLSIIYFRKLDFKKAWKNFDGRLGLNEFIQKNYSYKLISNKLLRNKKIDPNKKLLIIREQGVGDEILYGTIYEDILKNYDKVFIEADQRLIPLFLNSFGDKYKNRFSKLGNFSYNSEYLNKFDQVLYAGSLGYYFRNNIEDFPKKNYMKITNQVYQEGKEKLKFCKKKFKIGLSWKSFKNIYSNQKSINLKDLDFIINSNEIDFINLQYGDVDKEINDFNQTSESKIIKLKEIDLFNNLVSVGSILKNIDLFITVSNSTAHLAGALGVKTLLIKPFKQATFHYWNQPTQKTPWYDSVELLEREELNDSILFKKKVLSKLT